MFSHLDVDQLSKNSEAVQFVADHLVTVFNSRYRHASELIHESALEVAASLEDVSVEWVSEPVESSCSIHGRYFSGNIVLYDSGNNARNFFTLLHELGHHLISEDSDYQFQIAADLGSEANKIEEKIADSFAAAILLPDFDVHKSFQNGPTSSGILELIIRTRASASACAVEALKFPGDRLIILATDHSGIFFASSNGEPFCPRKDVSQPVIIDGATKARQHGGSYKVRGGEGIRYSTGNSNTRVAFDIAVQGSLIVAVITPEAVDSRVIGRDEWWMTCDSCLDDFRPSAAQRCATCEQSSACPTCGRCSCKSEAFVACTECFTNLSLYEISRDLTVHEECP